MGILDHRLTIVVSLPPVGLMGKELAEEGGFGGLIMTEGAFLSLSIHSPVWFAAAEAATKGAGVLAPVLDV